MGETGERHDGIAIIMWSYGRSVPRFYRPRAISTWFASSSSLRSIVQSFVRLSAERFNVVAEMQLPHGYVECTIWWSTSIIRFLHLTVLTERAHSTL